MKKKIAIVDDDEQIAELVALILENAGYAARTMCDSTRALSDLRVFRPDLTLLDLMMPGIDGRMILQDMAVDRDLARVPVIVITARPDAEDDISASGSLQVRDYLPKPFEFDAMLAMVAKALG